MVAMTTSHEIVQWSAQFFEEQNLQGGFVTKPLTASMLHDAVVDALAGQHRSMPSIRRAPRSQGRLTGMRLLLVEDNLNLQQVARELLSMEGRRCRWP